MARRKVRKRVSTRRKVTRRKVVRRRVVRRKPISSKIIGVFRNEVVREALSAILIIAILYFGIQGAIFLILRTDSPMMAVDSNSMKHTSEGWKNYYLEQGYDPSKFSFQDGFEKGDLIILKSVNFQEIAVGDVIVFWNPNSESNWVHRVAKIENGQILTKGDANPSTDQPNAAPPITPEEVRGKVILVIPKLGWLSLWIRGE